MSDPHRIESIDALRTIYRMPAEATVNKERPTIDTVTHEFLERCRFAVVGTFDNDGNADTSPRGGDSGFVRVLDERHVAIADLGGNNRLDTLQNVVTSGRIACIFVVPGQSETVRVNGGAWVTTDPAVLATFGLPRLPKSAIVIEVETTYMHCAKAFYRGGMWEPEVWAALADVPDGAAILSCQLSEQFSTDQLRGWLDESYTEELAAERTPA